MIFSRINFPPRTQKIAHSCYFALMNACALVRSFCRTANTLYHIRKVDFWFGVLTINGYAVYVTWTFLAANINLAIYTVHKVSFCGFLNPKLWIFLFYCKIQGVQQTLLEDFEWRLWIFTLWILR